VLVNFKLTWSYMDELGGTVHVVSGRIWVGAGPPSSSSLCGNNTSSLFSHLTPWPRGLHLTHLVFCTPVLAVRGLEIVSTCTSCHSPEKFRSVQNTSVHAVDFSITWFPFSEIWRYSRSVWSFL